MKKTICFALAAMFSLAALSACTGGGDDPNALTIMGKESDLNKPYMTRIFEYYRNETGEKLNIKAIHDDAYETTAVDLAAKGELPDVFLHFHNADLGRIDVAANFAYLNGETWVDDLTDSAKAYCLDADGNLLGLPFWESSVSGCYYNTKLLKGLDAPTTQEDFDGLCELLMRKGTTPILWPAKESWMMQFGLDPVFADRPEGPLLLEQLNENQTTYAEIPAVTNMVTWIADAAKKGWFGDDYLNTGWNEIGPALASGKAAMTFIWDTWFYTDFPAGGQYTREDFALMPVFMNTVERGTYEGGNLNMMMVNKNSEKLQKALDFLEFCATPANYERAFEGISTVSVFRGQTTNIQSKMVTDAAASIAALERVSTANTKIIGYSAGDVAAVLNTLFSDRNMTVEAAVARMDADRIAKARAQHTPGF